MRLVPGCLLFVQVQLLLQVTCVPNKGACPECGDGWVRVKGDRFCYQYSSSNQDKSLEKKNFDGWVTYCQEKEATLPILKTGNDRENFKTLHQSLRKVYLGLYKRAFSSQWKWLDKDKCNDLKSFVRMTSYDDLMYFGKAAAVAATQTDFHLMSMHNNIENVQCQKQGPNITTVAPSITAKRTTAQAQGGDSGLGTWAIIGIILAIGGVLQLLLIVYVVLHVVKQRRAAGSQSPMARQEVTAKDDPSVGISPNGAAQVDNTSNASLTIPPNQ